MRDTVPEVVIADIRTPPTQTWGRTGRRARNRSEFPQISILLLSAHAEVDTAIELLESGDGLGYLLESCVANAAGLLDAVERVCEGGSVIDAGLVGEMLGAQHRGDRLAELTPREREALALMAEGRSNRGIAQTLWITEGAVEEHVRHILAKLDLPSQSNDHRRVSPSSPFSKPANPQQRVDRLLAKRDLRDESYAPHPAASSAMSSSSYAETITTDSVGSWTMTIGQA